MGWIFNKRGEPKDTRNIAKEAAKGGLIGLAFGPPGIPLGIAAGAIKEMMKDPRTDQRIHEDDIVLRRVSREFPNSVIGQQTPTGRGRNKVDIVIGKEDGSIGVVDAKNYRKSKIGIDEINKLERDRRDIGANWGRIEINEKAKFTKSAEEYIRRSPNLEIKRRRDR